MKNFYLYRLFRHSRIAFAVIALFIVCYTVGFSKKMDMVFFPYNNMYAGENNRTTAMNTYGMKINGKLVYITHHLYWKKDLLETSLNGYCRYLEYDKKVFMDDYLLYKFGNSRLHDFLLQKLTAGAQAAYWPYWFAAASGTPLKPGDEIDFYKYRFRFDKEGATLVDSSSIQKIKIP